MNWYRRLFAQVQPVDPSQDMPPQADPATTPPSPAPSGDAAAASDPVVQSVVNDFLTGKNVEPITAGTEGEVKTAGVTGHYRHKYFIDAFSRLPNDMKNFTRENFKKMIKNPQLVGLKKLMGPSGRWKVDIYSAQVGRSYRALAVKVGGAYIWYYIGSHESYNGVAEKQPPAVNAPPVPAPNKAELPKSQNPTRQMQNAMRP